MRSGTEAGRRWEEEGKRGRWRMGPGCQRGAASASERAGCFVWAEREAGLRTGLLGRLIAGPR